MPAVVDGAKGRAKLFDTLNRTGAHFISLGSASSGSDRDSGGEEESKQQEIEGGLLQGGESNATRSRSPQLRHDNPPFPSSDLESEGENMSVRYSRVTTTDGNSSPITEAERSKRRRSQLAERISNKLHALFWAVVGIMVAYQTDFLRVLMEDDRVNRFWFNIGVICFGINVVILAYLTVWLPHVKGVTVSWNVYCPRAIPTATVVGLICTLTLNVALWNVWGFLTPLILFAVFIGCLFTLHFIPWPC